MKKIQSTIFLTLFLVSIFPLSICFAQQEYTRWGLPEGAIARFGKGQIVGNIAYSPNGTRLAMAGANGIWLYDTTSYKEISLLTGHTDYVYSVVFSPDGRTLASASGDNTVRLWDPSTGEQKQILTEHEDIVSSVVFSPDGRTLVSASRNEPTIILWDVETGALVYTLFGHTDAVTCLSFRPDGKILASGSLDGNIYLWDVTRGELTQKLENQNLMRGQANIYPPHIHSVSFSPDGQMLASGGSDNTIRLWDVVTGVQKQTLIGHASRVYCISFSPDSATLVSGSTDGTIRLWDTNTGQHKRMLSGHTDVVTSVAFSPDRQTLASGSWDCSVLLWNIAPSANATD